MAFWTENTVEPKRNFRFQIQIGGQSNAEIFWWAKTVTTPSFDVGEVEHNFLDNKYKFPGRVTWNDVSMTLVDPISVDAVARTNKLLQDSGYRVKNEASGTGPNPETMSKKKAATGPLELLKIMVLNADGRVLETWTLKNPFLKSAKYGDLDYSSDELRTVEMTFAYDWAECEISNPDAPSALQGTYFEAE